MVATAAHGLIPPLHKVHVLRRNAKSDATHYNVEMLISLGPILGCRLIDSLGVVQALRDRQRPLFLGRLNGVRHVASIYSSTLQILLLLSFHSL